MQAQCENVRSLNSPRIGGDSNGGPVPGGLNWQQMNNFYSTHYRSGEELRIGDRVLWNGDPASVVFVLGNQLPSEWSASEHWFLEQYGQGFMLDTQVAGLVFECESDEDLKLVERKPADEF